MSACLCSLHGDEVAAGVLGRERGDASHRLDGMNEILQALGMNGLLARSDEDGARRIHGRIKWQPVAFIGSNKRVLRRVLGELGVGLSPDGEAALNRRSGLGHGELARM